MTAEPEFEHFIYARGGLQYAVPVGDVVEIVELPELLPFPGELPGCVGNIAHRGLLVPVLDSTALGACVNGSAAALPKAVIIVRRGEVAFGLSIERYVSVAALGADPGGAPGTAAAADEAPGRAGAGAKRTRFVEMVRGYRDGPLVVLSTGAIAAAVERAVGDQRILSEQADSGVADGATTAGEAAADWRSFLCVRIGHAVLAIPVEEVIEVTEGHEVTPLFRVHPGLRGLITLRGQILACVDISPELGLELRVLGERNQFVVLQGDGVEATLCVDRVLGIRRLPRDRAQKADAVLTGEIVRFVHDILEEGQGTTLFLSVPDVFDSPNLHPYRRPEG